MIEEIILKIKNIKEIYNKSKDQKVFITSVKNLSGNILNDEELLEWGSAKDKDFYDSFKEIYEKKREERVSLIGEKQNIDLEKRIFLQVIDSSWRSHLQYLEQLRQVIRLRSYGQKDPLSEFKKEAFILFENLLLKIKNDLIKFLLNLNIVVSNDDKNENNKEEKIRESKVEKKVGRNEKCPCGSGKKFKHCHGNV